MSRYECLSVTLQTLLLVAGIATVVIYFRQLKAMEGQLRGLSESVAQGDRELRASANAAAISFSQHFLTVEFHDRVRRPAWHALRKGRRDPAYRAKLVTGFALSSADSDSQNFEAQERRRRGHMLPEDKEYWALHDEYHRVLDILGFFTSLSLLNAEPRILKACNYFYDSWRLPLWRLVLDAEKAQQTPPHGNTWRSGQVRARCQRAKEALERLDRIFTFHPPDPSTDPYFETFYHVAHDAKSTA